MVLQVVIAFIVEAFVLQLEQENRRKLKQRKVIERNIAVSRSIDDTDCVEGYYNNNIHTPHYGGTGNDILEVVQGATAQRKCHFWYISPYLMASSSNIMARFMHVQFLPIILNSLP